MSRLPGVRVSLLAGVLAALIGIVGLAVMREASLTTPAAARGPRPTPIPPRPALTVEEETYALALWPIHSEVKASALKMTFGGMSYKLRQIDRATLKARVEAARKVYGQAAAKVEALRPPPSMQKHHRDYLEAVALYARSASEMERVYADGRDEHLVRANPLSLRASEILLEVGNDLWPSEYKPN